jgi:hypothetical protein
MRTPSYGNLQALSELFQGKLISDSIATLGDGFRARRRGPLRRQRKRTSETPMTFSPELEARFEKMIGQYPPGRQKGALIPMLLYAQDEVGQITDELIDEVARGCR